MPPPKRGAGNAQVQSPVYKTFDGGLNIRDFWHTIADNELTLADNVRLDEGGVLRRRGGWTKLASAAVGSAGNLIGLVHGAWLISGTLTRYVVVTDGTTVYWLNGASWTDITGAVVMSPSADTLVSYLQMNNLLIGYDGKNAPYQWNGAAASISLLAGSPPVGNIGIVWQNRVWFAGANTARTRAYYSDAGDPETYGASSYIDVPSPYDGDEITGFSVLYGNLVVFKRRSIYIIQGDAPSNFTVSATNSSVGCVSPYSIVNVENLIYFVSDKGLYAMNLSNTKQVCYKVEPRYNAAVTNQLSGSLTRNRLQALHYRYRNEIWVAADTTAAGQDQHNRCLAHNYNVVDKKGDPAVSEYRRYGELLVTVNSNDRIDFTENGGAEVTAQLTAGTYPLGVASSEAGTLCALVKSRMEAAGSGTYTVTYSVSTDKMTITRSSGVFVIRFASGTNTAMNASGVLGFSGSGTTSAISATSNSTVAARALATSALRGTAPAVMADYFPSGTAPLPLASFYDKYVYVFSDTATTDAVSTGTAMAIPLQFTSGYKDFGDSDATKTLRNVWTSITFAAGTPRITIGVLSADFSTETTATLTPSSPTTFYNAKQSAGQIYGSSPQGRYFKFGFTSDDGGTLSFFELSFDIVWNGRRA